MSFRHRQGGEWADITLKRRVDGEWVAINDDSSGDGGGGVTTEMIDSFERSSLERYWNTTSAFSISSDRSTDGTRSLYSAASGNQSIISDSGSGGQNIPEPGDTVRYDIYPTGGSQRFELCLARIGAGDRVVCHVATGTASESYINVVEGGTPQNIAYSEEVIPEDQWLEVEVQWGEDNQSFNQIVRDADGNPITSTAGSHSSTVALPSTPAYELLAGGGTASERWVDNLHRIVDDGSSGGGGGGGGGGGTTGQDDYNSEGMPLPNSDGPFGIHDGDVDNVGWSLGAADDFTESTIEDTNWNRGFGWGGRSHGNTEEYCRDEDVWVSSDDKLVLQTMSESQAGETAPGDDTWFGGAANTLGDHSAMHGYFEASIRMPTALDGTVVGFWGRGAANTDVWPPEIDYVERFGEESQNGHRSGHTVHWNAHDGNGNQDRSIRYDHGYYYGDDYHVFGCWWTSSACYFYFDGTHIATTTSGHGPDAQLLESQGPFYSIFTNHIWPTSWFGYPNESEFPAYTRMDWFRYWSE